MPFGPFFAALPTDGGGNHYIDQPQWDQVVTNFGSWAGNVNGGGNTLSNTILDTSTGVNSITPATIKHTGNGISSAGSVLRLSNGYATSGGSGAYEILGAWANSFVTCLFTVRDNGYVGIGTASPLAPLVVEAVSGIEYLTSTTGTNPVYKRFRNTGGNAYIGMENSAGGSLMVGAPAYTAVFNLDSAHGLALGTSNTLRLIIDSAGKTGVGTASPVISSSGKFHHSGDTIRAVDASRTPANSAAAGNDGELCMDASYLYIHTSGSWRRAAFAAF